VFEKAQPANKSLVLKKNKTPKVGQKRPLGKTASKPNAKATSKQAKRK
jgi:hypothetical protein